MTTSSLLSGVLPWIYSRTNAAKRQLGELVRDPVGSIQQTAGGLQDWRRETDRLHALAFADPKQPLRPTDQNALKAMIDRTLAGPMGFAAGGMTKMVAPQEAALAKAQENAVKMLGLPPGNTPMDRAKAQGFVDAYHGTADDIKRLDPAMFGSSTGANSAKKAFWAVDNPTTARGYAEYAATDAKVKKLLDAAGAAEKRGKWDQYDDLVRQAEELEARNAAQPLQGQNIMPLMVRTQKGVRGTEIDAKGAEFADVEGGINRFLNQAVKDRRDIGVVRNLADDVGVNGRPATHFAALNPSVVRSRFAAFDPARIHENDLLGAATPQMLGLLAAGSLGTAAVANKVKERQKK